jgi:hypothetical protein
MYRIVRRAFFALALMVTLSRPSFGNDIFPVTGRAGGSGDITYGFIDSPFTFEGISGMWFDLYGDEWTVGSHMREGFGVSVPSYNDWTFNGRSGQLGWGDFSILTDPFVVEAFPDGSLNATGIPLTWTGEVQLLSLDGRVMNIEMAGVGTASFSARESVEMDQFVVVGGDASLTGVGQITTPEPSTLTLIAFGGIALFFGIRFRRRFRGPCGYRTVAISI